VNAGQLICLIYVLICLATSFQKHPIEQHKNTSLHMIVVAVMFLAFTIMKVAGK
jgi:hypothetical protein